MMKYLGLARLAYLSEASWLIFLTKTSAQVANGNINETASLNPSDACVIQ
jgi:hypothetical protein